MQSNARTARTVATLALAVAFATAQAGETKRTVGDVVLCFSITRDEIPAWGTTRMDIAVKNGGSKPALVSEPEFEMPGLPRLCEPGAEYPSPFHEIAPGTTWFFTRTLGIAGDASLSTLGDHVVRVLMGVDVDGDHRVDEPVVLEAEYHVVEPPPEVLTFAQERGVEVELCKVNETGGGVDRVNAIAIPWQTLENEHQARVRESIALPPPAMTPEEIAARGGRLPKPNDPDDQKRLEEALKTDPAYLRWEALRGEMGLYAGFDYAAALREIRTLTFLPKERRATETDYFQDMYGPGLDRRVELGAGDSRRIQRTVAVFLEQGKPAALEYLETLAKKDLRCADRTFLEEVRAIVLAAPDSVTADDVTLDERAQ